MLLLEVSQRDRAGADGVTGDFQREVAVDVAQPAGVRGRADCVDDRREGVLDGLQLVSDLKRCLGVEFLTALVVQAAHLQFLRSHEGFGLVVHVQVGAVRNDVAAEGPVTVTTGQADQDGVEVTVVTHAGQLADHQVEVEGEYFDVHTDVAGGVSEDLDDLLTLDGTGVGYELEAQFPAVGVNEPAVGVALDEADTGEQFERTRGVVVVTRGRRR